MPKPDHIICSISWKPWYRKGEGGPNDPPLGLICYQNSLAVLGLRPFACEPGPFIFPLNYKLAPLSISAISYVCVSEMDNIDKDFIYLFEQSMQQITRKLEIT